MRSLGRRRDVSPFEALERLFHLTPELPVQDNPQRKLQARPKRNFSGVVIPFHWGSIARNAAASKREDDDSSSIQPNPLINQHHRYVVTNGIEDFSVFS